jgi:hypothetical protein
MDIMNSRSHTFVLSLVQREIQEWVRQRRGPLGYIEVSAVFTRDGGVMVTFSGNFWGVIGAEAPERRWRHIISWWNTQGRRFLKTCLKRIGWREIVVVDSFARSTVERKFIIRNPNPLRESIPAK